MPGDLIGIGDHGVRQHGFVHAEPVRAQAAAVDEREQQAWQRTDAQLFGQLSRGGLFIGLAGICGATDLDLIEPGEARYLLRASVDEDPSTLITTDTDDGLGTGDS